MEICLFMKKIFLILLLPNIVLGQRDCATDEYNKLLFENDIIFNEKQQVLESYTNQYIDQLHLMNTINDVQTIPVVVHIIYHDSIENILQM